MEQPNDHTHEVERRVAAIRVRARDSCGFFKVREGALAPRRECFFCAYGKIGTKDDLNPEGLCNFKK
ncbi:MAG: hypothetical protein LKJ80_02600 [Oscillibacter sp.]|nr:hypothetical protein [Oscillibacter sp.]